MNTVERNAYKLLVMLAVGTIATGTIVYHFSEKISWVDAYYFSVVTLSTVGYGDITPHTTFQKLFTTFYIFIGVGILTTFLSVTMKRRGQKYVDKQQKKQDKSQS